MAFDAMKKVSSSFIHSLSHEKKTNTLLVRFNSGQSYYYDNVPRNVYKEILACDKKDGASVGKTFYSLVRQDDRRPFKKVTVR